MQIFHYRTNEGSEPLYHGIQDNLENVIGGPRIATILIFLSNVSQGGEIIFPKSKIKDSNSKNGKEMMSECASTGFAVKHVKSNALLIFNLHPNATVDESSLLGGCSNGSMYEQLIIRSFFLILQRNVLMKTTIAGIGRPWESTKRIQSICWARLTTMVLAGRVVVCADSS
ncbi:hypothetical protein M5K25_004642 [Dendrobium thyrsiflorum]|uniref:Uncharacterized protein n=1 Tax=Dendrobium thyrsiflorum TaxID=117978 RepID=A0ABD0VMI0_DENTH